MELNYINYVERKVFLRLNTTNLYIIHLTPHFANTMLGDRPFFAVALSFASVGWIIVFAVVINITADVINTIAVTINENAEAIF